MVTKVTEINKAMPKKVIHVVSSRQLGGLERRLEVLDSAVSNFPTRCHKVSYVNISSDILNKTSIAPSHLIYMPIRYRVCGFFSSKTFMWMYLHFKRNKYDVVHAHDVKSILNSIPAAFFAKCGVRVSEFIGATGYSIKAKIAIYPSLFMSTNVIAISSSAKKNLLKSFPLVKRSISYVNNPVVLRSLNEKELVKKSSEKFRVCFVGRLEDEKNPLLLIEVFFDLLKIAPQAELWIIGEGSLRPKVEKLVKQLGIQASVYLHGEISYPEHYVSQCDIYIQTSKSEGFGIAIVEAMLLGVPVIITEETGAACLIENGVNSWVVNEYSSDSFVSCLREAYCCGDKKLSAMGSNLKKLASEKFSPGKYIKDLEYLYWCD